MTNASFKPYIFCLLSQFSCIQLFYYIFILVSFFTIGTSGHGMMCEPRQRGAYHSQKCGYDLSFPEDPVTDYCAHCLNGGTISVVSAHLPPSGWQLYEPTKYFYLTSRAGLCGDPYGRTDHMIGGFFMPTSKYRNVPLVKHYRTGSQIDFLAEIDTNHNGYFEFFLCDLDKCGSTDIAAKCFKNNHCYKLARVPHPDCEDPRRDTKYECGPIDERYPGRFYLPCRNPPGSGLQFVGGPSGTMRYQLPKNVKCKHCVIHWYWATANSCAPRGLLNYMKKKNNPFGRKCESDGGGKGTYRDGMMECGGTQAPEEFWSCADVQITDNGKAAGPVKAIAGPGIKPNTNPNQDEDEDEDKEVEEAEDNLKDKKETENQKDERERKEWEEYRAERGECLRKGAPCDASRECCDHEAVCVFTAEAAGFSCEKWWSLYKESELKDRIHNSKWKSYQREKKDS